MSFSETHHSSHVPDRERTVLLVGRDGVLRDAMAQALQFLGCAVLEAGDGDTAVSLYRQNGDQIGLALLDVESPLGEVAETYRRLRALNSRLPAITLSSYSRATLQARLGENGFLPLRKPISIETLEAALETAPFIAPRPF